MRNTVVWCAKDSHIIFIALRFRVFSSIWASRPCLDLSRMFVKILCQVQVDDSTYKGSCPLLSIEFHQSWPSNISCESPANESTRRPCRRKVRLRTWYSWRRTLVVPPHPRSREGTCSLPYRRGSCSRPYRTE